VKKKLKDFKMFLVELNILDLMFSALLNLQNGNKYVVNSTGNVLGLLMVGVFMVDLTLTAIETIKHAIKAEYDNNPGFKTEICTEGLHLKSVKKCP
jgi:steroid 5-alpha reductase family enzyme